MRLSICFTIDSVEFTAGVIAGEQSLGGSESACVGLARALQARGHDVHIFTTQLGADAPQFDHGGVGWHPMNHLGAWSAQKSWDVAIALRQPPYLQHAPAKVRILWCQDLMANETMKGYVMSFAWLYDAVAYVSEYHRHQWEGMVPELAPIGWVTKNGHDAELAKQARTGAVKRPNQIIHISRPERGLLPLLKMWPLVRAARPDATLAICRYSSMYDPQGWGEVCKSFDSDVEVVNRDVGGITYLGELGKPALYRAISESAVMWYPGVSNFGETSCIAAIEAQACGTPFVGSYKGALNETVPSGTLIHGKAEDDPVYHEASVAAVVAALDGCQAQSFDYRRQVKAGLAHVEGYRYEAIAAEWEAFLLDAIAKQDRPEPRLTAGIIVNRTLDLRRCLDAVCQVADEVILGDTGAPTGALEAIAAECGPKVRVVPVGTVADLPGGFSQARNAVLATATGDWFLWIDDDEVLCGYQDLRKYLRSAVFNGFVIPQNHLHLDAPMGTDTPVRMFKRRPEIQFYGCVHEQPQWGDCNGEIQPALQVADVQIAHTGYLHEAIRRDKALNRNLPLLVRDQQMFPDRILGKLLVLREHANLAQWARERTNGAITSEIQQHYAQVVGLFEKHFADPTNKHYPLAKPFYEQALRCVNGAIEVEIAVTGQLNGLNGEHARPERVWVRTADQMGALLHARIDALVATLSGPPAMDVEPLPQAQPEAVHA